MRSDWLSERARWLTYLPRSGFLVVVPQEGTSGFGRIKTPSLTKLVRSSAQDFGLLLVVVVVFVCLFFSLAFL